MGGDARELTACGLVVRRGDRDVLAGVDLELARGELVALLGPNGAGKTSLLAVLGGLLAPAAGVVERRGRVAAALQTPAMARRSVRANLELALGWWGVPRGERAARAAAALERVRAAHLAGRLATTLSGGEARRVHLARVLALEPDVLLLDEPFAGLDDATRGELLYDTASALRSPERATLVVLHDRAEAWALADRLVILLDGAVAADGPPSDVLAAPPSPAVAAFLGYSGRLREPSGRERWLRPSQVSLDPSATLRGRVRRRVPLEDGFRVEVETAAGIVVCLAPLPGPADGAEVGVRVEGGVVF